ncbi:MAG: hypothetical protein ACQESX_02495 [Bacteroidota bacterium]
MKNLRPILSSLTLGLLITAGMLLSGCTKEGPEGPAGEDGADGADGLDGEEQCGTCHDMSTDVKSRIIQWEASKHATGGNFNRNDAGCAGCHTNEGFRDVLENEATDMVASGTMENPTMIGCRTCHKIHESYSPADWNLTNQEPVTLIMGNDEPTDHGTGNVCASCHQARQPSGGLPEPGGEDVEITYFRWGPHHGTQANMISGQGGFEIPGDMSYGPEHTHYTMEGGCNTCHMAEANADLAGGHTMAMAYEQYGSSVPHTEGCQECHTDIESFDFAGTQTDVRALLDELRTVLMERNMLDDSDHIIPDTYSANEAGSVYNYLFVLEDYSDGVHNHRYAKALLNNTLDWLEENK